MKRVVTIRKTTLEEADDARRDREFWATVPPLERLLHVFTMSEEGYAFVGKLPEAADGRHRSVARILRP
jgi:hypothetical protein